MKFNQAMLALSASNPGLLPLAFDGQAIQSYDASCHDKQRVSVEHSFKEGSGDEIRGIAVDNKRAADAYQKALKAIDNFKAKYSGEISEIEAKIDYEIEVKRQKREAEREQKDKKRKEKELEDKINNERRNELLQKKNSFWGLSLEEKREYEKLNSWSYDVESIMESHMLVYEMRMISYDKESRPSFWIDRVYRIIYEAHAIAVTSQNVLYLSRNDVIEIYEIETNIESWLSRKAGFACVLRHVETKSMNQQGE